MNDPEIFVRQFESGSQGKVLLRGKMRREIVTIQLLESHQGCVSGTPTIRMGKFVEVNGSLREVEKVAVYDHALSRPWWAVTLASDEELPRERYLPLDLED